MNHLKAIQSYWDARSRGFSDAVEEELHTEPGERWRALFKRELPAPPARVLDCGTGAGFFAVLLAELGYAVNAVDYSGEMLNKAAESLSTRKIRTVQGDTGAPGGGEVFLARMDAQRLEFGGEFDAVVSRNLIWNLEEPEKSYESIERVLKPGGLLMIEDGNHYLHLHDSEYAELARENRPKSDNSCHARHNTDHVDFSVMERIAEDLPLSRLRRPQWDAEQLIARGFSDIRLEIAYRQWGEKKLPGRFLITARKQEN